MIVLDLQRATHLVGIGLERRRVAATQAEGHVLAYLAEPGELSIRELQTRAVLRPSTLTAVLDRLEARGLVRRAAHPRDRRSTLVKLTPRGRKAAARVGRALTELDDRIRARAGRADAEAFGRVLAALEEELG